jgi:hypothetical protein
MRSAAKWWSHYPVDGTYGSWGDRLDLDGGQLEFNVPAGKIFDPRVGTSSNNYARIKATNGAKITFVGAGKGWPRAFASYFTDAMIQGSGSSTLTDYGMDFQAGSATDPTVTSDGAGVGSPRTARYHYARNLLFDQAGCVNLGSAAGAYYDWDLAAVLRGKHATTDWRIIGVSTIRNATALRRFKRLRVQRGVNITSTVAANADQNGLEFIDCTLKLVTKSFTNTRCKVWQNIEWEAVDGNGQSPDAIPAADVSGYLCTGRGTTGNPKVMNSSNGVFAIPAIHDLVCEVSQESNVGSLGDSGEWYQHDKEHRDGTTLTDVTFIGAEDGTAFRIYEVAALSNPAGNNDSYPAPNPFGQVVFDRCRGNAGPSALGQGHTPGSDIPGTDRVRFKNGTLVGAHANATGGSSQAFNNQSGPSTVAGAINNAPAADPNYLDAILVAQVTGNRFVRMSAGAQHPNGGTDIWAMLAAWGIQQSALTSAQRRSRLLQTQNTYYADWGRSADAANFLNSAPRRRAGRAGPPAPHVLLQARRRRERREQRRARYAVHCSRWAALAAQDMANHLAFGGAHPDFVASLIAVGARGRGRATTGRAGPRSRPSAPRRSSR